jgi:hypothetical protein
MSDATKAGDGKDVPSGRLPYEKPAVAWEEEMAQRPALMALCAKLGGDPACDSSPGAS